MIAFSHVKGKEKQPVEAICQSAQWSLESPEDADCMVEMGLCTVYYIYCTEVVWWRGGDVRCAVCSTPHVCHPVFILGCTLYTSGHTCAVCSVYTSCVSLSSVRQACSSQIQYLLNSTKITSNTETAMLSIYRLHSKDTQCTLYNVHWTHLVQ